MRANPGAPGDPAIRESSRGPKAGMARTITAIVQHRLATATGTEANANHHRRLQ